MPGRVASGLLGAALIVAALPAGGGSAAAPVCPRVSWLEVHKEARRLRAWCEDGTRLEMDVALGRSPRGTKHVRGDGRTPEGAYRITSPARASRFHLFVPIDYPSRADAAEGLASGRIGEETYARILSAHRDGMAPPQSTALGGHVGLHGQGRRWRDVSHRLNWTRGCIALRDAEIEALAERVSVGTPVYIYP